MRIRATAKEEPVSIENDVDGAFVAKLIVAHVREQRARAGAP